MTLNLGTKLYVTISVDLTMQKVFVASMCKRVIVAGIRCANYTLGRHLSSFALDAIVGKLIRVVSPTTHECVASVFSVFSLLVCIAAYGTGPERQQLAFSNQQCVLVSSKVMSLLGLNGEKKRKVYTGRRGL